MQEVTTSMLNSYDIMIIVGSIGLVALIARLFTED